MALPENVLSDIPVLSELLSPDNLPFNPFLAYELGGIDVKDSTQGLMVRNWFCWFDEEHNSIRIQSDPDKDYTVIENIELLYSLDFTFDQNMNYTIVYELPNFECKLHWFDAVTQSYIVTSFFNIRSPRLTLDDKREQQLNVSDIIFVYITKDGKMAYRQQRDRFGIERILKEGIPQDVFMERIGMSRKNRIQFNTIQKAFLPECGGGVDIS